MLYNAHRGGEILYGALRLTHVGIRERHVVIKPREAVVSRVELFGVHAPHVREYRQRARRLAEALERRRGVEHDRRAGDRAPHAMRADERERRVRRGKPLFAVRAAAVLPQKLARHGQLRAPVAAFLRPVEPCFKIALRLRLAPMLVQRVQPAHYLRHVQRHGAGRGVRRGEVLRCVKAAARLNMLHSSSLT